jgi:hypothetical protein
MVLYNVSELPPDYATSHPRLGIYFDRLGMTTAALESQMNISV